MKLLADAMLGRLAKWLRMLGYDTTYVADTDSYAVLRSARAEGRLILTRDRELATRKGVRGLFIDSDALEEQLEQVYLTLGAPEEPALPRCSICNQPLHDLPRQLVVSRVPPFIYKKHERFKACPECHRVYWRGSHWGRIQIITNSLHEAVGSDKMADADDQVKDPESR
jgi:uncharacterized protein with PIN domain